MKFLPSYLIVNSDITFGEMQLCAVETVLLRNLIRIFNLSVSTIDASRPEHDFCHQIVSYSHWLRVHWTGFDS